MNLCGFSHGIIFKKSNPSPAQFPSSFFGGFSGFRFKKLAANPLSQLIESSAPLVKEVNKGSPPSPVSVINKFQSSLELR
jgi:hypothetical protein